MRRILKEPLLHFLLLGAGFFITYSFISLSDGPSSESRKIVITQGLIEHLVEGFSMTWLRSPTDEELAGLLRDRVREEVYYREAMLMGLDKDDTVIRRRLRQKMEFISEDLSMQAEPTDADLEAYLRAHPDMFRVEQRFTFSQIYFNPERRGENIAGYIAQLLTQLNRPGGGFDQRIEGDPLLLEHRFVSEPAGEVAKLFGKDFAANLSTLPIGKWHGPIKSGYGLHLVLISERTEARLPALEAVRGEVHRQWRNTQRIEENEKFFQKLLQRYEVTIDDPLWDGEKRKAETK